MLYSIINGPIYHLKTCLFPELVLLGSARSRSLYSPICELDGNILEPHIREQELLDCVSPLSGHPIEGVSHRPAVRIKSVFQPAKSKGVATSGGAWCLLDLRIIYYL